MAKMSRQHFQFIADTVKALPQPAETRSAVAHSFAVVLRRTNPGFKPDRFLKACGVE